MVNPTAPVQDDGIAREIEAILAGHLEEGNGIVWLRDKLTTLAERLQSPPAQDDDAELEELLAKAKPLMDCEHRANRPNDRQKGERVVGFVIGENDIGLGLSEPLFALEALVRLARRASRLSPTPETGLVEALTKCRDKFLHYEQLHRLKCTSDGDEKADRNRDMADMCDRALSNVLPDEV